MSTSKEDSIKDILAANRNDYKRIARLLENGNVAVGGADKLEKEADRRAEQLILAREEAAIGGAAEWLLEQPSDVKNYTRNSNIRALIPHKWDLSATNIQSQPTMKEAR